MSRIAALSVAAAALSDARSQEEQAAAVVAQGAADPSGIDDMERLASDDRQARERAASGRVLDALRALKGAYPVAFELAALPPAEEAGEDGPPIVVPEPVEAAAPPTSASLPAPAAGGEDASPPEGAPGEAVVG